MKLPVLIALTLTSPLLAASDTAATTQRLNDAASALSEIRKAPDNGIPHDLFDKARCVVIVPGLKKGAFVVGAEYGKGFMTCRGGAANAAGTSAAKATDWSAPGAVRIEGGSFGFQIGGQETDLILLVMNESGVKKLLQDKFTLGGDASVAAGPVGRSVDAESDVQMHAEILAWSRSQGVFAGVSLQGATLRDDLDDNATLYGSRITNKEIINSGKPWPKAADPLMTALHLERTQG